MALELLGGRALGPYFGSGIYVWGAIITLFMLSLSIGYLIGGSLSATKPSLQKLSAILLPAAVASLPCALASNPLLEFIFDHVAGPRHGALAASVALFFLPITVSGAVSPYAVRLLVDGLGTSGKVAGANAGAKDIYQEKSLYRDFLVYDDQGLRCMKFGRHDAGRQTCIAYASAVYNLKLNMNNRGILSRNDGLPSMDDIKTNAERLENTLRLFGVGKDWLLPLFSTNVQWPPGTRILADQYSPANLLNGTGK